MMNAEAQKYCRRKSWAPWSQVMYNKLGKIKFHLYFSLRVDHKGNLMNFHQNGKKNVFQIIPTYQEISENAKRDQCH